MTSSLSHMIKEPAKKVDQTQKRDRRIDLKLSKDARQKAHTKAV